MSGWIFAAILGATAGTVAYVARKNREASLPPKLPQGTVLLPNPIPLTKGARYRARFGLSWGLNVIANHGLIQRGLEGKGFSKVSVYRPNELPTDWPSALSGDVHSHTWMVEGTWIKADSHELVPADKLDGLEVWQA